MTLDPEQKQIWSLSQPHTTQYTGLSHCVSDERSMPLRDQILTWPSSPPVASAVPEGRGMKGLGLADLRCLGGGDYSE